ncbi:uncharacterized protein GGR44_003233 [Sphingobium fontiphilum]|uniref:DUF418 domain-containing protein n=1 Tax=Sphingobium fontiphilum TaxID=944425 RepID=A0A7W6DIU3_9SPHN|nr:DUF418 domain-containing protein [Sphingobium fontiphilum]MBB3983542.1 uncharacterized protein [Sphingobium fontiphilum]
MSPTPSRVAAMDMLRGVAVLGILWMNITAFAQPSAAYLNPAAAGPLSAMDKIVWLVGFVVVDGKMRALFAMLFGASMLLAIDKAEMAGRDGWRAHVHRAIWLLVIGLTHYLLLWWGDILAYYAIVGVLALPLTTREPMALIKWALIAFLIHFLLVASTIGGFYLWQSAATAADAAPATVAGWRDFTASMSDPASTAIQDDIAIHRSGLPTIIAHRIDLLSSDWLRGLLFTGFEIFGFMALGMAMLKSGFLLGQWDSEHYRQTARHCFLIAVPPMLGIGLWVIATGFELLPATGAVIAWSFPFRIPLAVGWASLLLWLFRRQPDAAAFIRLGTVGRFALSNYLGSSLLMTAIFYGWGIGLFARVGLAQQMIFVLAGWALILLWSPLWAARFRIGPAEWIWRCLASRKLQKLRL